MEFKPRASKSPIKQKYDDFTEVHYISTELLVNTVVLCLYEPYLFICEIFTHIEMSPSVGEVLQI